MSFIVHALPRSRTYWLSRFLTYGGWYCGHEEARHVRALDDVASWFKLPNTGTVETGAAPFWRMLPPLRTVTIRRPVDEVVASLQRLGVAVDPRAIRRMDAKLDQIEARVPGVLRVTFEELRTEAACRAIFEHCLPYPHDSRWWRSIALVNMQCHLPHIMAYGAAYRPQIERVTAAGKATMLAGIERRRSAEIDGITFGQEFWDTFLRDGEHLFEESSQAGTGTHYRQRNLGLCRMMSQIGSLQITTARCNGRMFGFVLTAIGPSLDTPDDTVGMHITTFASKQFPGLGRKLVRAANEALAERGVMEVMYRVGDEQEPLHAFYRRIGAEHRCHEYMLRLQ